jgi:hypothetical protein
MDAIENMFQTLELVTVVELHSLPWISLHDSGVAFANYNIIQQI